jgi:zinc/manganese transport system substrate-binding protein
VGSSLRRLLYLTPCYLALASLGLAACGAGGQSQSRLQVVAAEDFWGSIASQLGGDRANVSSIIVNPDTDPHSYEPTPSDARTLAGSTVAIVNGIGYDNWASQLLAADSGGDRIVVSVGEVLGLSAGDNPHQWYSPSSVRRVVEAIVAAYDRAEPVDAHYFAEREHDFETDALGPYDALRREIRSRYAGVAVGYSESIFAPLGQSLGLRLLTPPSFADAVAEGGDVTAQDTETVERQARDRLIRVWIFNSQNVTPVVDQVNAIAQAAHIPIVTITETLSPPRLDFEQWQVAQLARLLAALRRATGR